MRPYRPSTQEPDGLAVVRGVNNRGGGAPRVLGREVQDRPGWEPSVRYIVGGGRRVVSTAAKVHNKPAGGQSAMLGTISPDHVPRVEHIGKRLVDGA